MRHLLPLILCSTALFAQDGQPSPHGPGGGFGGGPGKGPMMEGKGHMFENMTPEQKAEAMAMMEKMRALREKAFNDPDVQKLQKALRDKTEEVMSKDPEYPALRKKMDEFRAKAGLPPRGEGDGPHGPKGDNGAAPQVPQLKVPGQ